MSYAAFKHIKLLLMQSMLLHPTKNDLFQFLLINHSRSRPVLGVPDSSGTNQLGKLPVLNRFMARPKWRYNNSISNRHCHALYDGKENFWLDCYSNWCTEHFIGNNNEVRIEFVRTSLFNYVLMFGFIAARRSY